MFDTVCTLPLSSDLFAQAVHPSERALAVGLASGHVQCFRLPPTDTDDGSEQSNSSKPGCGTIDTQWRTKRHKISCRALAFSLDGQTLYSAGADGLVKAASSETGQVSSKIAIPIAEDDSQSEVDAASVLQILSPQTLLLATDSSALHIYDLRSSSHTFNSTKPAATYFPHEDYVTSLSPLPPSEASTSGFSKQWVSTGGTTLSVTDIRKGVLTRSAEQDDELTSSLFVGGFSRKGTSVGQKIVVGDSSGVLSLFERGVWDDLDERIVLDRGIDGADGESVESLALIPRQVSGSNMMLVAGMGGGLIACVQLGSNRVVDVFRHDEIEAVNAINFDVENRMITGGGQVVKVWQEKMDTSGGQENGEATNDADKHSRSSDESEEDEGEDSSGEDERQKRKKKKRKVSATGTKDHFGSFKGLD